MPLAEHFTAAPNWGWWILGYFFLAGISGGCYVLGTMLRLWGQPRDAAAARIAFMISFVALLICPILLTADLGRPDRFWHMLIDSREGGFNFMYLSPMSVGVWGLQAFGVFATISFLESLVLVGRLRGSAADWLAGVMAGTVGRAVMVIGSVFALFVAAYTGVLLSVSNQPVWSDTWALGGLFLASGMSGAAAALLVAAYYRREMAPTTEKLERVDVYFVYLEALLIAVFLVTIGLAGSLGIAFRGLWPLLWLVVLAGMLAPLARRFRWAAVAPQVAGGAVLVGVLALRAVIIFSAQS